MIRKAVLKTKVCEGKLGCHIMQSPAFGGQSSVLVRLILTRGHENYPQHPIGDMTIGNST